MQPDGRLEQVGKTEWGITCGWCHKMIDGKNQEETEKVADALGWRLNLDCTGQAHFACPDCVDIGYHPVRFLL